MAAEVVPLRRPKPLPPTRSELIQRVRILAKDSANMQLPHPHLRERMEQRGISMRLILETIRKGEGVSGPTLDPYGDWRIKLKRLVAGRRVQVVVAIGEKNFTVVTVI